MPGIITIPDIIERHSMGASPGSASSLQLLVNRFAQRYDADMRDYIETTLLRIASGAVHKIPSAR